MVNLSLHLVLFAVDAAVCMVLHIGKEHPALDRFSNKSMTLNVCGKKKKEIKRKRNIDHFSSRSVVHI